VDVRQPIESRISEPESSSVLGTVDGRAGSVCTFSRLATSAGKANASFCPVNSGAVAGDALAATGVVMPVHQDTSFARCAIPAPITATSTRRHGPSSRERRMSSTLSFVFWMMELESVKANEDQGSAIESIVGQSLQAVLTAEKCQSARKPSSENCLRDVP